MKKKLLLLLPCLFALTVPVLASCGKGSDPIPEDYEDDGKEYELTYYMVYNAANTPQDLSTVQKKLSSVLKKKINSTIKIIPYTLSEYTSKLSGAIAAEAKFDVCFTSPDVNPYLTNVQREAFVPLDKLLPKYAPETWKSIPTNIWEQARINGKIYGSVNEQIFPRTFGFEAKSALNIQTFLDEEYGGITPDQVYTLKKNSLDFLEEYLGWLKENNKGCKGKISELHTESTLLCNSGFDDLGTGMATPGVIQIDDKTHKVINQFKTDDYKEIIDRSYKWRELGYIDDAASAYDLTPDTTWKPGYKVGNMIRLSESHYFTSFVVGTMNAISTTSKNPARAMKFIELMRTDEEVHNLIQFGVEEVHYIKDPDNDKRIAEWVAGSGYNNSNFGWGLGTEFISYLQPDQEDDLWEQVKAINDNTPTSDLIGFNFDATKVKQKIADCKAIINEFLTAFSKAQFKPEQKDNKYQEMIQRLEAAGCNDIIDEKQKQIDAFFAAKNSPAE